MSRRPPQDPELLAEIISNYQWAEEYWGPIHREGNTDVKFVAGDPWDPRDIQARESAEQKRPHLVFDEGSQYINMFCGQAMQQKRAVKVEPASGIVLDADTAMESARVMQERIYHIDYVGRGQAHSIKALKDCATRGYGWMSMRKKYSSDQGREQEPCWNSVANPDSRLADPNFKEPDGSDMEFCFVRDIVKKSFVKRKWKWAKNLGKDEIKTITLTEYWKVTTKVVDRMLYIDDGSEEGQEILESKILAMAKDSVEEKDGNLIIDGTVFPINDQRDIEERSVTKYICQLVEPSGDVAQIEGSPENCVEILEIEPWDGKYIPEIPVLGPEFYINSGGTVRKVYLSMLRRARHAMELLNLCRTTQAELIAMVPKTRAVMYEGQPEGHEDEWNNIGSSPLGYLLVKPVVDPITQTVLPLPTFTRWEPPLQALELLAQGCMNAIRTAIGQLASPELDKTKSGVALEKIRQGGESAVYHILDSYELALQQVGRVEGDLMERTHDTKRTVAVRDAAGEPRQVQINAPYDNEKGERVHYPIKVGSFAYTISTGPSYQSQFEQASEFVDLLVGKMPNLLIDGSGHTTFGDLFVQLKNMGPIGDKIMERFKKILRPEFQEGTNEIPPQVAAEMQKAQQIIDALTEKVNSLAQVIDSKQLEIQSEERRNEADNRTKIAIAEINAQVKENIIELQTSMEAIAANMNRQFEQIQGELAHQRGLEQQTAQQQHEAEMTRQAQEAAQQQRDSQTAASV